MSCNNTSALRVNSEIFFFPEFDDLGKAQPNRRQICKVPTQLALSFHIPLTKESPTRYVKLRVAHAPGMPGTFSPPLTSKQTAR